MKQESDFVSSSACGEFVQTVNAFIHMRKCLFQQHENNGNIKLLSGLTKESYSLHTYSPNSGAELFLFSCISFICKTLAQLLLPESKDVAPALTLVGQSAGPHHEGQIAVLIWRISQIGYTLEACAPKQAGFPVREGVKALAAVVRAHPTGTCQRHQERRVR